MSTRAGSLALPALLAVAILLAGGWLRAVAVSETRIAQPLRVDAMDYTAYAINLDRHGVYSRVQTAAAAPAPDARRAPGYPSLLRFLIAPDDTTNAFVRRVTRGQAVIGTVTLALVLGLA